MCAYRPFSSPLNLHILHVWVQLLINPIVLLLRKYDAPRISTSIKSVQNIVDVTLLVSFGCDCALGSTVDDSYLHTTAARQSTEYKTSQKYTRDSHCGI